MENNQTVIVKNQKSVGISIILTLLLGPLGLFYSTINGAMIMIVALLALCAIGWQSFLNDHILFIALTYILYIVCCLYMSVKAVNKYNQKLVNGEDTTENSEYSLYGIIQFIILSALIFCSIYAIYDIFIK